jgi:hypothetical protein
LIVQVWLAPALVSGMLPTFARVLPVLVSVVLRSTVPVLPLLSVIVGAAEPEFCHVDIVRMPVLPAVVVSELDSHISRPSVARRL